MQLYYCTSNLLFAIETPSTRFYKVQAFLHLIPPKEGAIACAGGLQNQPSCQVCQDEFLATVECKHQNMIANKGNQI